MLSSLLTISVGGSQCAVDSLLISQKYRLRIKGFSDIIVQFFFLVFFHFSEKVYLIFSGNLPIGFQLHNLSSETFVFSAFVTLLNTIYQHLRLSRESTKRLFKHAGKKIFLNIQFYFTILRIELQKDCQEHVFNQSEKTASKSKFPFSIHKDFGWLHTQKSIFSIVLF